MKIGELFVSLGFQADQNKLDQFNAALMTTKTQSLKVAAAFSAVGYAFLRFTDSTVKYAVSLKNFAVQTGLSIDELEKWRYVAEKNDVSGGELVQTLMNIQRAQAEIKLGGGNIRPWQLLGIDPNENPFQVLSKVRESVKDLDPALASSVIGQLGIGQNFLNILRSGNLEFDNLNKKFLLTKKETENLLKLNRMFKEVIWSLRGMRNRLSSISAEPLEKVLKAIRNMSEFVLDITEGFRKLFTRFKGFKTGAAIIAAAIAAYFFPVTAGVTALMALIDDLYVYLKGGDSVIGSFIDFFDLQPLIDDFKDLLTYLKPVSEFMLKLGGDILRASLGLTVAALKDIVTFLKFISKSIKYIKSEAEKYQPIWNKTDEEKKAWLTSPAIGENEKKFFDFIKSLFGGVTDNLFNPGKAGEVEASKPLGMKLTPDNRNSNTVNNINVNVNESSTPRQTAQAVMNRLQMEFNDTYFQTPILGVS